MNGTWNATSWVGDKVWNVENKSNETRIKHPIEHHPIIGGIKGIFSGEDNNTDST